MVERLDPGKRDDEKSDSRPSGAEEFPFERPPRLPQKWQRSTRAERQEFFLPVSGFIWFYPEEVKVIDHPAFQRLSRINQLGQAHLVFRGATHKRIEHVMGVVSVISKMISATRINSEKNAIRKGPRSSAALSPHEERFLRLGALLHDIGHIAAGHTLEDELALLGKHDADQRLSLVFSKDNWDVPDNVEPESLETLVDRLYANYVTPKLRDAGLSPTDIVRLLIRKPPADAEHDPFKSKQEVLLESSEIRFSVCSNMIGNTICADLLDYIYRDWYHVGKMRSVDDRIFQYMEIRRKFEGHQHPRQNMLAPSETELPPSSDDRFVISLGRETKVRTDGVSAILNLLEWRYELAEAVLFHRTKVAAGAMLDRALFELWETVDEKALLDRLLEVSDEQLIDLALSEATAKLKKKESDDRFRVARGLLQNLKHRRIYAVLAAFNHTNLIHNKIEIAKRDYGGLGGQEKIAAANRTNAARNLEKDFELPPGSLAIYCSTVKPKIAEVSISVDDSVMRFADYEDEHDDLLSGGHLKAQINRFDRMWRIQFFIEDSALESLGEEGALNLRRAISDILLSDDDPTTLRARVQQFAKAYVHDQIQGGKNSVSYVAEMPDAAWRDETVARKYPNGADCIRNFIRRRS
ncbi:hypothetical protein [Bradyrhizobium stylosanthis]|uniref:HD superfamily phosphohydrolase n=1 Tax=Bradyrhizobium stylosanthis TaxID=1803665 RepID=A0A560EDD1_9BRAD|nr:hypothetical protein [Bradyrhizobium stylosanthis]TWB07386.1 HD superfamily phosphohydrolase [Bradyrhizobium stylosanthis]